MKFGCCFWYASHVMGAVSVRNTAYELKASIYSLGVSHLEWVGERVANLRHVRGAGEAAGAARASMGFTPWEQLWWMLGALVFFHSSEFLLALAYHGRRRVNAACKLKPGFKVLHFA